MTASTSFNAYQGYTLAMVEVYPTSIRTEGGNEYPCLIIPAKFTLSSLNGARQGKQDVFFLDLNALLFVEGRGSKIAHGCNSRPFHELVINGSREVMFDLEFPLDKYRVEKMEQLRKGDMGLRCYLQLSIGLFGPPIYGIEAKASSSPRISDLAVLLANLQFAVPQSKWVKEVLPGLGGGVVQLIEFPAVSLEACEALKHSHLALKRAVEEFALGDYDAAVGLCRTAADPIRQELKKLRDGKVDCLAADWAEKVGSATIEWLTIVLGKTHGVANTPHHSPTTGYFSRLDAQMILTTTISVIAYVARFNAAAMTKKN